MLMFVEREKISQVKQSEEETTDILQLKLFALFLQNVTKSSEPAGRSVVKPSLRVHPSRSHHALLYAGYSCRQLVDAVRLTLRHVMSKARAIYFPNP